MQNLGAVARISAGGLEIGYVDIGSRGGSPVFLLHGWPDDILAFEEAGPMLAAAGYRVIIPCHRGFGTTVIRTSDTLRNGQQAAFAVDVIALIDALRVQSAVRAGFDWAARTANVVAALWPERCKALVSVSGKLIGNQQAGKAPLSPASERAWWYQFYFVSERGRASYSANCKAFARLIWESASPHWQFSDAMFDRSAPAFDNLEHVAIVVHNYRWRLGLAAGDPRLETFEEHLAAAPPIIVPTITLEGDANGAPHSEPASYAGKFKGQYAHRLISGGVGYNLPQEAPHAFADAVIAAEQM